MAAENQGIHISTGDSPTLREALSSSAEGEDYWFRAIQEELDSFESKDTWELDSKPQSKPLSTHVVCNVKRDAIGNVDRFKVRIVAGGNQRVLGLNYKETYAAVIQFVIVRIFLYLAVSNNMCVSQLDVKTAFLNGALEEDIWVLSPCGIPGFPSMTYKLKSNIWT